ncbi:helix-turn-helix domain-containing protein [Parabacteroides bouchesdurhonensis]|uniref:helix-turn-helix domain-containing protein n=2 Tax=Parabacteroides bouchesdurhonensis TaxID=1936995 RepID=UPI001F1FA180|nr:helix-turn-helix domain-containing protein [Parabacteroides bouchesdurhonensis]
MCELVKNETKIVSSQKILIFANRVKFYLSNMENLPLIEIAELNESIVDCDSFQNDFSIADVDGKDSTICENANPEYSTPMRLNALLMVLVTNGSAKINIDYIPYTIKTNSFITIMPTHTIQLITVSKDFKARILVASRAFLEECNPNKKGASMVHYMQIRKNPCSELLPEEARHLEDYIQYVREKTKLRTHLFQKEVIQNALIGFFLELANIFIGKKEHVTPPVLSRKEELFEQFLQLLFEHCKEQHVVTFYAEKLFITPQYLSLILKELTGKSANKWIDDALIIEAKMLLKAPQATVQQVADTLHFSDQSTFGKFFKKHMGISPMEYRKS